MTVTRTELMLRAARSIGARVGTISSGTAATAVLGGLINSTGDETAFNEWRLIMPDATAEADKEKFVTTWEDESGTAHFTARVTDTSLTNEHYILSPRDDYSLAEYRDALEIAIRETGRTYRQAIPLAPRQRVVPLGALTWLLGTGTLSAAWVSDNPNLLHNSDFGKWTSGPSLAPDGWTLSGAGALVSRTSTGTHSPYGVSLTRATNNATLTQSIPRAYREYLLRSASAPLTALEGVAWVTSDTASIARIGISNGTSTTYSTYHTGTNSLPERLTVSYTPTATDTDLALVLSVDTTDGEATFLFAGLVDGDLPAMLYDDGDSAYVEHEVAYVPRNVGGQPAIELLSEAPAKQLVTYSRRPLAALSADTDVVDDEYARALEAGLLVKLLQIRKPNQDRTRLDIVMREEARIWNQLAANFTQLPVPRPQFRYVVQGA